jgi:hypothetical protein
VVFATKLGQTPTIAASDGDAARAFADKASERLRLLSGAAQQVLATPGVEQEPLFSKSLHKVSAQLQESATILQKWGEDYAHNADANEMAVSMAEHGAAYEVQDLKRQLRLAIEADQEAQLDQPRRLAEVSAKVANLRSQLDHLAREEDKAHQQSQKAAQKASLLSDVWPRPPKNAKKAELGLFMHGRKMTVTHEQQDEEERSHLAELESRLGSLEDKLQETRMALSDSHEDTLEAHEETQAASRR